MLFATTQLCIGSCTAERGAALITSARLSYIHSQVLLRRPWSKFQPDCAQQGSWAESWLQSCTDCHGNHLIWCPELTGITYQQQLEVHE